MPSEGKCGASATVGLTFANGADGGLEAAAEIGMPPLGHKIAPLIASAMVPALCEIPGLKGRLRSLGLSSP